eukprot:COSAG06_NODE_8453_length_2170_cov_2.412844_2_plen_132_part_00
MPGPTFGPSKMTLRSVFEQWSSHMPVADRVVFPPADGSGGSAFPGLGGGGGSAGKQAGGGKPGGRGRCGVDSSAVVSFACLATRLSCLVLSCLVFARAFVLMFFMPCCTFWYYACRGRKKVKKGGKDKEEL